jgi:hypothetical protein
MTRQKSLKAMNKKSKKCKLPATVVPLDIVVCADEPATVVPATVEPKALKTRVNYCN